MAERKPLAGWKGTRYSRDLIGGRRRPWRITASSYGNWTIEPLQLVEGYADGGIEAAQIAAEDAARVFVGALAAALGGRVVWGNTCPGCGATEPDIVVNGETQCGRCGMIGAPVESEDDHG